jgi:hypothetical protein
MAIETVEEERVRSLLIEVATDLKLPFYEWVADERHQPAARCHD